MRMTLKDWVPFDIIFLGVMLGQGGGIEDRTLRLLRAIRLIKLQRLRRIPVIPAASSGGAERQIGPFDLSKLILSKI